jgi:hypothetical protein
MMDNIVVIEFVDNKNAESYDFVDSMGSED